MSATSAKYTGFVYAEYPQQLPTAADALAIFKMFSKAQIKSTRKLHSLFARGFGSKMILKVNETGVTLSENSKAGVIMLDNPIHKIYYAAAIEKSLLVFVRRSGYSGSFKCHVFDLETKKVARGLADTIARLVAAVGFRRDSMLIVGRTSSMCSVDMLPDGYIESSSAPTSTVTSPAGSDAEDSDDESPVHDSIPSALPIAPREPAQVESADLPCGVCNLVDGHSWIALKTCGHQFHLPCMSIWRTEHNVCPTCSAPLSAASFSLRYLGGCFTEESVPSLEELIGLADDYKAESSSEPMRVQVNGCALNLLDRLGNQQGVQIRSTNSISEIRSIDVVGPSVIVLVMNAGLGHLVQFFEPPFPAEAHVVASTLRSACKLT